MSDRGVTGRIWKIHTLPMIMIILNPVWWSLKEIQKGFALYDIKSSRTARAVTALAREVAQGYKDEAKLHLCAFQGKNEDALPSVDDHPVDALSNVALCVNPNEEYVLCAG